MLGQGFSRRGKDNNVKIETQELSIAWDDTPKEANEDAAKTVSVGKGHVVSDRELRISDFDKGTFRAPMKLSLRVGDVVSESVPITFATVDEDFPRKASIWIVIGLLVLVAFIMLAGTRRKQIPGEPKIGFIGSFLLDQETDTYSLSKLQFYLWTFAGIFGYCFLTLCRSVIQGHFELAEIPDGLPGIIGASAGTSIFATGITSARGPKGAGPAHPGFADFFTSDGVVAPERFQFFIWTLVGVASFVGMIALYDPASVTGLPKIPPGFLYMMGISSTGYLGGKFVRKPGPVIDSIDAQYGSLKLEIRGRNLFKDASYLIGDKEISYKLETGTTQLTAADEVKKDATLKIITKEEDPNAETFAKAVLLTIAVLEQAWVTGKSAPCPISHFLLSNV